MASHKESRRAGSRKAVMPPGHLVEPMVLPYSTATIEDRLNPIPRKRLNDVGQTPRSETHKVAGPIRVVLEPMLWMALVSGVTWLLVSLDPGVRRPEQGVVLYQHTLPLAILIGTLLVISGVTALMWLPTSVTATRARTSFAGLGMLASGWLFAKVNPIETTDFLVISWLSIGVGVLLVTICAVPWPTTPARPPARPGPFVWSVVALLLAGIAFVSIQAWQTAGEGLVGRLPEASTGWDHLLPLLALLAVLIAGVRMVLRMPARTHGQ